MNSPPSQPLAASTFVAPLSWKSGIERYEHVWQILQQRILPLRAHLAGTSCHMTLASHSPSDSARNLHHDGAGSH